MKHIWIMMAAAGVMAACSTEDIGSDTTQRDDEQPITFGSGTQTATRAVGTAAAKMLGGNFHLFGTKTVGGTTSTVFGQTASTTEVKDEQTYHFWHSYNTANTSTTNSSGWEYVGAKDYAYIPSWGVNTVLDNLLNNGTTAKTLTLPADQTIKFWDWSATQYDFMAYSMADGEYGITRWTNPTDDSAGANVGIVEGSVSANGLTVKGVPVALNKLHLAKATVKPADYGKVVTLNFKGLMAKVRLGFYETIPGYYVSGVKSKVNVTGSFIGSINKEVTAEVTFDEDGTPSVKSQDDLETTYDFGYLNPFGSKPNETLPGTSASNPRWTDEQHYTDANGYEAVWPNSNVANMTLTLSYTLHAEDTNETIDVDDATCTVPAAFMRWDANHAYTYLFKLTDSKLKPIAFDAVAVVMPDGEQETVTTFDPNSITTYSEGSNVTENKEYKVGETIYVTVNNGKTQAIGTGAEQSQMYKLNSEMSADEVKNALNGTGLTEVVPGTVVEEVPGVGTFSAIKYTLSNAGTYAFVYMVKAKDGDTPAEYAIKIIKVS